MSRRVHEYEGEQVSVSYDAKRCIHAAECVHGLPAVFNPDRRPWVDPEAADADAIAGVIERCPTGALRFERLDGGPAEAAPAESVVTVATDGPLYVQGDLRIGGATGEPGGSAAEEARVEYRAALCRCGESANKPFCDNTHHECGFEDPGAVDAGRGTVVEDLEGEAGVASSGRLAGPLSVTAAPNGPLMFGGMIELRSGDEATRTLVENPALCRCGHSRDKPFCDGTHFREAAASCRASAETNSCAPHSSAEPTWSASTAESSCDSSRSSAARFNTSGDTGTIKASATSSISASLACW